MCMHLGMSFPASRTRKRVEAKSAASGSQKTTGRPKTTGRGGHGVSVAQALVVARTTLATKSYDFDEARLRSRNAAIALEASHAAFAALAAERDRLAAGRLHPYGLPVV